MGLNVTRDRLCLVQISDGYGDAHLVHFPTTNYSCPNLRQVLSDPKRQKIFHFARFDLAMIECYLGLSLENVYCTKIASRLARTYTEHHGLKDLCSELLDIKINKQQQCSDWGAAKLSDEQIAYAASDVLHLHKLRNDLNQRLTRENRMEIAEKCFTFLPARASLDILGWPEFDIFAH